MTFTMPLITMVIFTTHFLLLHGYTVNKQ